MWRLLVARALYKGSERREDPRVAVGSPVELDQAPHSTVLVDLSNRGCRLQTTAPIRVDEPIEFTIPENDHVWYDEGPLTLRGTVRRLVWETGDERCLLAVLFDADLPEQDRTRLTALINHWASGPPSVDPAYAAAAPVIPSAQLPSLPDLTLDDETDPPIPAASAVAVALASEDESEAEAQERRAHSRGHYETAVAAEGAEGPFVLIGRDLSAGGMRIERHPDLRVGDRFKIALHAPSLGDPILAEAEIVRDDGDHGFGLAFDPLARDAIETLEKFVACLPDVESLEAGELAGLGAILSEIVETHPA